MCKCCKCMFPIYIALSSLIQSPCSVIFPKNQKCKASLSSRVVDKHPN